MPRPTSSFEQLFAGTTERDRPNSCESASDEFHMHASPSLTGEAEASDLGAVAEVAFDAHELVVLGDAFGA